MDFYINKNSTLPHLKVKIQTTDLTSYEDFNKLIKTAKVTFSMKNLANNVYKIASKNCEVVAKHVGIDSFSDIYEYYIVYEWSGNDTKNTGSYIAEFNITFKNQPCESLIVPIREELFIHVMDSFAK
jgi:hypothetical protein